MYGAIIDSTTLDTAPRYVMTKGDGTDSNKIKRYPIDSLSVKYADTCKNIPDSLISGYGTPYHHPRFNSNNSIEDGLVQENGDTIINNGFVKIDSLPEPDTLDTLMWVENGVLKKASKCDATFQPQFHYHTITSLVGITDSLAVKSDTDHVHQINDVTGLTDSLGIKSDTSHTHYITELGGTDSAFGTKSDTGHTHYEFDSLKIGGTSNNVKIDSTGITLNGSTTVWDDQQIVATAFDYLGANDPDLITWGLDPVGSNNTALRVFQSGDIAYFTCQFSHRRKNGTNVYAHILWTPHTRGASESGHTVNWQLGYSWASIDSTFPLMDTVSLKDTCTGVDNKHLMTSSYEITGTGKNISSMIVGFVKRTSGDTWSGTIAA